MLANNNYLLLFQTGPSEHVWKGTSAYLPKLQQIINIDIPFKWGTNNTGNCDRWHCDPSQVRK